MTGKSPLPMRNNVCADGKCDKFAGMTGNAADPQKIRYRLWVPFSSPDPPIVILVIQQPLTIYSTMFYGEAGAEDYSGIPSG